MERGKNKTDEEKEEEHSVLNTPPTPESPLSVTVLESSSQSSVPFSGRCPPKPEEIQSIRSEIDGTIKAHSVAGELQDLQSEGNTCPTDFDASVSSSSNKQPEPQDAENEAKKILQDAQERDSSSKKQKTSLKPSVNNIKKSESSDLENLTSAERITVLQAKMQEIRKHYLLLKSEVAAIDRRKRLKKKKQERASAMPSSSSNGMSGE
ncbi:AT-rich interactive domain-containing protein 4B-like isoform X1 [Willisornis vidua]|uniref:AT-rich interactive domain-containing protein 4B-like isoform X1 n=1 Tax=Willisornis vidua TaxID=1566151 RepID=A0ABQ9DTK9_9PASS|nr:AT-rich interactive domain-containing protein 4B-like isoform X1 [Willisornis vidua]